MFEKTFELKKNGTKVSVEFFSGLTTFLTMSYIIFVNGDILSMAGMDKQAVILVTCLISAFASIFMGLWANLPIAQAPGMGLNAFFTFTLCLQQKMPWQTALGVVFISGMLFVILTFTGIRKKVVDAIPESLRFAIPVGIGLFITLIGMKNLGLIVGDNATLVKLGTLDKTVILGMCGLILMGILFARKIKGAILIGILAVTGAGIAMGITPIPKSIISFNLFWPNTVFALDIAGAFTLSAFSVIISFAFVDLFDSLGTMIAVAHEANLIDKEGNIQNLDKALQADAISTVIGAIAGTSTTTSYIESATGVAQGGRTGLSPVFTGLFFLVSVIFLPLFSAVPSYATAPALIIVGLFMMGSLKKIDFNEFSEGIPAFLTIVMMPFTFSISHGIGFGFLSYLLLKTFTGKIKETSPMLWAIGMIFIYTLIKH